MDSLIASTSATVGDNQSKSALVAPLTADQRPTSGTVRALMEKFDLLRSQVPATLRAPGINCAYSLDSRAAPPLVFSHRHGPGRLPSRTRSVRNALRPRLRRSRSSARRPTAASTARWSAPPPRVRRRRRRRPSSRPARTRAATTPPLGPTGTTGRPEPEPGGEGPRTRQAKMAEAR